MSNTIKGVILMTGFLSQALSAMFKENEDLVAGARTLGGVAACRVHRREEAVNLLTGERTFRWEIEFKTKEDSEMFDAAVRRIVGAVVGEEE